MASIDSKEVTNVEDRSETDISTSEVMQANNDRNLNVSTVAKVDEETVLSSDLFAYDPAKYSFCKEKSIVNTLKVGDSGAFEFLPEIKRGVYGITLCPESAISDYKQLLEEFAVAFPEDNLWKNRRPNVGDFVFGKMMDSGWCRGYVISMIPYLYLAVIDEARTAIANQLATCTKPISDLCTFSGICELADATRIFHEGQEFPFKVTGRTDNEEQDEFEILILDGDLELKATVKPWIPMPEHLGIQRGVVNYGTTVCVTGYQNHTYLYVRPLDTLGLARYNFIMETVAKCAETYPYLEGTPDFMNPVLALSADGNYYRAYVTKVEDDRVEVMYQDLGRTEYVDRKKLKIFPDYLEKLGYAMTKILLQDVPKDITPFEPLNEILDKIVESEAPLICTYDGIPHRDGVYLKYPDGESVNNMICKFLDSYCVKDSE